MHSAENLPAPHLKTGHRVMIVDDDPINNLICEELLTGSGFAAQVTSFEDPRTALGWLEQHPGENWPDLLLLDINMPGLNGWEFLAELGSRPLKRPLSIRILSSSVSEFDLIKGRVNELVEDYLVKPLSLEQLSAVPVKRLEACQAVITG